MKYSQTAGFIFCILLIIVCFMPWSVLPGRNIIISGMHAAEAGYGRPGLLNIILTGVMALFFLLPFIWSKRSNVFIAALNISWCIRNYILVTACSAGECPQKHAGIYFLVVLSILIFLCTFFPRLQVKSK